jgi:FkbM family methyltransferase
MKNNVPLDIKLINYISRKLNDYVLKKRRKEKVLSDKLWRDKFKSSELIIHQLKSDIKIKLYEDSILSKLIYEGFENSEIDFLNTFLRVGDCFLDIGANVGLFSLYASRKVGSAGSVISFEPSKLTYSRLLENLELNGITNVSPYKLGLSNRDEILELNVSVDGHDAWNTFVKSDDTKFSSKEAVQVKTFDSFSIEYSINTDNISLIKLDVEGFEINVLQGAPNLLSKENAPVFMVEFTDNNSIIAGHCCHELYKLLLQYDYSWYTYDETRKKLIPEPMRLNYPYNNLIAVKNGKKLWFLDGFNG